MLYSERNELAEKFKKWRLTAAEKCRSPVSKDAINVITFLDLKGLLVKNPIQKLTGAVSNNARNKDQK